MLSPGQCLLTATQAGNAILAAANVTVAVDLVDSYSINLMSTEIPNANLGVPYSEYIVIGSTTTINNLDIQGLPPGITASYQGNGLVLFAGTPTSEGAYPIRFLTMTATGARSTIGVLNVFRYANTVSGVAAGNAVSCSIIAAGLRCWGSGYLGDGKSAATSESAVTVFQDGAGVSKVSSGSLVSCAVVNGGLYCWGSGVSDASSLGNGSSITAPRPTLVFAEQSNVIDVAVGNSHVCAVIAGGVQCWGSGSTGQVGSGGNWAQPLPVTVIAAGSGAVSVAVGYDHSCAVVAGGVKCWGKNGGDNLLNAPVTLAETEQPITSLPAGSGVLAIAIGSSFARGSHTCALLNGGVQCWGFNATGQLGSGDETNKIRWAIAPGNNVTAISAGSGFSCAVSVTLGGTRCWGLNDRGQLGNNSLSTFFSYTEKYQTLPAQSGVTMLSSGPQHTCAVANGSVTCWGAHQFSKLGNDLPTGLFPTPVTAGVIGVTDAQLATYGNTTCIVVNGAVKCTERPSNSGLSQQAFRSLQNLPTAVAQLARGEFHVCVIATGEVYCAGSNTYGQFGNGVTDSVALKARLPIGVVATKIATGANHTCAIAGGGLYCWGANFAGQVGDGTTANALLPRQIFAPNSGVTHVSSGAYHTCAIVSGALYCWGRNDNGQLGHGTNMNSLVPLAVTAITGSLTAIAAGSIHTCAIASSKVFCWGGNSNGQLGDRTTLTRKIPTLIEMGSGTPTVLATGTRHSCAVVGGGVQCWGDAKTNASASNYPVAVIPAGSGATFVTAAYDHSCALIAQNLVCWGSNTDAQLALAEVGSPAKKVQAAITNATVPAAPIIVGYSQAPNEVTLQFASPTVSPAAAILSYSAGCKYTSGASNNTSAGGIDLPGNATSATINSIKNNSSISCFVVAINAAGTGAISNAISIQTGGLADPPEFVTVQPGVNAAILSYSPPSTGTSGVTGYRATCVTAGAPAVTAILNSIDRTLRGLTGGLLYTCSLASVTATGTGAASNVVAVTPLSEPKITIVSVLPASVNGQPPLSIIGSNSAANISFSYQVLPSYIRSLSLFDNGSLLYKTTFVPSFLPWNSIKTIGQHTLTVQMEDDRGVIVNSPPIIVNVLQAPTITLRTASAQYMIGENIELDAEITVAPSATFPIVEFRRAWVLNGVAGASEVLGNLNTPPYRIRIPVTGTTNREMKLEAVIRDSQGFSSNAAPLSIGALATVSTNTDAPLTSATNDASSVSFAGQLVGPGNATVQVNGVSATVADDGSYHVPNLELAAGANQVTVTVTTADGITSEKIIIVNRNAGQPRFDFRIAEGGIIAEGDSIIVPVHLTPLVTAPFSKVQITCAAGSPPTEYLVIADYSCEYTAPGVYVITAAVFGSSSNLIFQQSKRTVIVSAAKHVARVRDVFTNMVYRLSDDNPTAALRLFSTTAQAQYSRIFTALGTALPAAAEGLGTIQTMTVGTTMGEITLKRIVGTEARTFLVTVLRGEDGIWRIDGL